MVQKQANRIIIPISFLYCKPKPTGICEECSLNQIKKTSSSFDSPPSFPINGKENSDPFEKEVFFACFQLLVPIAGGMIGSSQLHDLIVLFADIIVVGRNMGNLAIAAVLTDAADILEVAAAVVA